MPKNQALPGDLPSSAHRRLLRRQKRRQRGKYRLKRLIEELAADYATLPPRGLRFVINELETIGRPLQRINIWATLHFLPLGSPFCCSEPCCHLPNFGLEIPGIDTALQLHLQLLQPITIKFQAIATAIHPEVLFDNPNGRSPTLDYYNIDARDPLGRTALMRAALRGHDQIVEHLLEAGANPNVRDNEGLTILEKLHGRHKYIAHLLQSATSNEPQSGAL